MGTGKPQRVMAKTEVGDPLSPPIRAAAARPKIALRNFCMSN